MVTCLVLGMGIPTITNYIITSSLAAPVLLVLGVPLIVSHRFVFYFGIMADLTPPVSPACSAPAPIARGSGLKISRLPIRAAVAGLVVPFSAVCRPARLMQGAAPRATLCRLCKAGFAIGLWGIVFTGYLAQRLRWWEAPLGLLAGALMILALPVTDELGLGLGLLFVIQHLWRARRARQTA